MRNINEIANIANNFFIRELKDFDYFMYNTNLVYDEKNDIHFIRGYVKRKGYNPMLKYKLKIRKNSVLESSCDGNWDDYFKITKMFDLQNEDFNEKLQHFDLTLIEYDRLTNEIFNMISKWKKTYNKKSDVIFNLLPDIEFKINESYSIFIEIVNEIYNLTFVYYRTYYGPFKEDMIIKKNFIESNNGKEAITKITYLLESFFVQFISLLDYTTKFVIQMRNNENFKEIESYSNLFSLKKSKISGIEKNILENLLLYSDELNEIRHYRNAMVHQKIIPKNHYSKKIDTYLLSDIAIAGIRKKEKSNKKYPEYEFDIGDSGSPRSGYSIVRYCTYAYFKLLSTIKNTFSILNP